MSQAEIGSTGHRRALGRRNLVVLTVAVLVLILGYTMLQGGSTSLAAGLLVLGYCVLFPLAIAL
jgi:hypothetical protein